MRATGREGAQDVAALKELVRRVATTKRLEEVEAPLP
jgi:hypothetical protein